MRLSEKEMIRLYKRCSKYRNIKVMVDGIIFDSKKESRFYLFFKSQLQRREIKEIICQPILRFPDGTKFIPDFLIVYPDNEKIYYDVKSPATKTKVYRLKKRLLYYFFPGVNFQEL